MDDIVRVHIIQPGNNAADEKFDDVLRKCSIFAYLVPQVSPWHEVHDEVEILAVLESINHVD